MWNTLSRTAGALVAGLLLVGLVACGAITGNGVFASAIGTANNIVRVQTYETSFSTTATMPMDFFLVVYAL